NNIFTGGFPGYHVHDEDGWNYWNISKTPGMNIIGGPFISGNYWSGYMGTDNDRDGIGDTLVPYSGNGYIESGGDFTPLVIMPLNHPPVLNPIGNKEVREGQTLRINLPATDEDNDPIHFSTDAVSVLPSLEHYSFDNATGQFVWRPNMNDAGAYNITFIASDGIANDNETITIMVRNVTFFPKPAVAE
ncbi:MAG: NosD domain-containing protein, partial [Nanoarchaeota archaeon]